MKKEFESFKIIHLLPQNFDDGEIILFFTVCLRIQSRDGIE